MKHLSDSFNLPPEFSKALNFLMTMLQSQTILHSGKVTKDILNQGSCQILRYDFTSRSIPSGNGWRWNQAKSRRKVETQMGDVTFFKLAPRRIATTSNSFTTPNLKLWKFCVHPKNKTEHPFYVLWCERGMVVPDVLADIPPSSGCSLDQPWDSTCNVPTRPISINDLEFLAPFMDSNVVCELWPSHISPFENPILM